MPSPIVQKENKILRKKALHVPLDRISSKEIGRIISVMKKALASQKDGVAIAAPQIGESLQIFVVSGRVFRMLEKDGSPTPKKSPKKSEPIPEKIFINPQMLKLSRDKEWVEEGCLSVRYLYGQVNRAKKAKVRAYDEKGNVFEIGGSGLLAQIFQHEMDHLEGILFIDKAKDIMELTLEEYAKQGQ
jgi:peptide deformylase